jgi:hypothetical protein
MGCGCGRSRSRSSKSKTIRPVKRGGVKAQVKPRSIKPRSRSLTRKTCPKCGHVMSHSILHYNTSDKNVKQNWICVNKKCRFRIEK